MPNGEPVKKRPMGLKARTAQKRRAESAGEPQTANPETATVILKNPAGGEDATEVDEVEAIYGNAEDALASGDTEQAIPLLRGTVHECDRILRNHYQSAGDSLPPLPSKFYYVYGMALFSLGELSVPDDAAEYFGLGRERLEQALEEYNARESGGGGREFKFKILSGIAKATLSQARFISRDRTFGSEITKAATSATELFNEALACIAAENDAKYFEEVLVVPDLMFAFVEANIEVKELQAAVDWGIGKLKDVVGKGQRLGEVYYQLARGTWVLASHYLEQQDEETGDVPEQATVQKLLAQAEEYLQKAVEAANDDESKCPSLLLLSEVQINKGNIEDEEDKQEEEYAKAVDSLLKAKKLIPEGQVLPEHLLAFIEDSNDDDDDEED